MAELAIDGGPRVRGDPWPEGDAGPEITAEDAASVADVVRSRKLWRHGGPFVRELEGAFASLHGLPPGSAVASTSGTSAIHLAVGALDPAPGDEIIVAPLTDFGTVIPILAQNAVPVFADVCADTFAIDPDDVARRIGPRTRAVVVVHLFGHPADVRALRRITAARGVALIEDCAQAPLADVGGQSVGTFGDFGCFSLQQSKHITTGEGGLTIAADAGAASRMRLFADKGWPREGNDRTHVSFGMNYRMTEMQGVLALRQLSRLRDIVTRRQERAARLDRCLDGLPGVRAVRPPDGSRSAYWLYPMVVDAAALGVDAGEFARAVRAEGVSLGSGYVRPLYWSPVLAERRLYGGSGFPFGAPQSAAQPAFAPGLCPVAEGMWDRLCYLSWSQNYTDRDVDDLGAAIAKVAHALAARTRGAA